MLKKKILVVDDEPTFTNLLKLNLEETGSYEVKTVNRGEMALTAAREFKPDLILLDVIMPDADGGQVAAQMQADAEVKNVPVLFLTAIVPRKETSGMGGSIGGQTFIAKPVTPDELVAHIEKQLNRPG